MSTELTEHFIVVKGYIDAKDDQQRAVYGYFMGIASRRDMRYLRVAFGTDEVSKDTGYDELRTLLENHEKSEQTPVLERYEAELYKFFEVSRTLQGIVKNLNVKHAEQTISRFCTDDLQLKAVTFVDFVEATETYFSHFLPPEENAAAESAPPKEDEEPAKPGDAGGEERKEPRDFVVRCEPVLDPVRGGAMAELAVGSYVCARLPEDSVFFKLFAKNFQGFDGIINAQVSGVLVNELGTATVSLQLADGVAGVMRMAGSVKVKLAADPTAGSGRKRFFNPQALPVEFVFGLAGIVILISVIWLIIYLTA